MQQLHVYAADSADRKHESLSVGNRVTGDRKNIVTQDSESAGNRVTGDSTNITTQESQSAGNIPRFVCNDRQ